MRHVLPFGPGEHLVESFRQHPIVLVEPIGRGAIPSLALIGLAGIVGAPWWIFAVIGTGLAFFGLILWWDLHTDVVVVTNQRIIDSTGFLGRVTTARAIDFVEAVRVEQDDAQRSRGFGTVHVDTGGREGLISLSHVIDPHGLASAIFRARGLPRHRHQAVDWDAVRRSRGRHRQAG